MSRHHICLPPSHVLDARLPHQKWWKFTQKCAFDQQNYALRPCHCNSMKAASVWHNSKDMYLHHTSHRLNSKAFEPMYTMIYMCSHVDSCSTTHSNLAPLAIPCLHTLIDMKSSVYDSLDLQKASHACWCMYFYGCSTKTSSRSS